jgi:hypothetical protein
MSDQPNNDRFKTEMPRIPGVSAGSSPNPPLAPRSEKAPLGTITAVLAVVLFVAFAARFVMRPKPVEAPAASAPPQLEVTTPAPDPLASLPRVTQAAPVIASVEEMAKPWSSKEFFLQDPLNTENSRALLIRLPTGSATQPIGYWGLLMTAAYGSCELEYVTDLQKLRTDYGFHNPEHAMIGDPCSRTVFDPLKMTQLAGKIWVRGAIVQGADVRPPFGIELKIKDKNIQAIRHE